MLNETTFQNYVLGWLYARDYTIECRFDDKPTRIILSLDTDDEYEHWYRITRGVHADNYSLIRREPSLVSALLSTHETTSQLYIYDTNVINYIKNCDTVVIDNINDRTEYKSFKRGYFDAIGTVELENYITCYIPCVDEKTERVFNDDIQKYKGKYEAVNDEWMWEENDALNFICDLYSVVDKSEPENDYYFKENLAMIDNAKQIHLEEIPKFIYYKVKENAVAPFKEFTTHPGFGISVCEKISENDGIHYYTTGLKFSCEYGYYLEIYGEELYKRGYMLANPFDVIKPGQDTELVLALIKLNPTVKELELPSHVANVIPKKLNLVEFYQV